MRFSNEPDIFKEGLRQAKHSAKDAVVIGDMQWDVEAGAGGAF